MILKEIIENIDYIEIHGQVNCDINAIEFNSGKVKPGTLFIAQKGIHVDGHRFISEAIKNGAVAIVCNHIPKEKNDGVTFVKVDDTNEIMGKVASAFYEFPSEKLKVVGVTGTNGKTSVATLLFNLFRNLGYKSGLISTISYRINDREEIATHTTPDALKIHRLMSDMVKEGCGFCFMEVSSHAAQQKRISGINFNGGVFTNITHDHLDYHKTFAQYIKAKQIFFNQLSTSAFALTNIDDKNGQVMMQNTKAKVYTYSARSVADFHCRVVETHFNGMLLNIDGQEVWTRFVGKFNALNLLAVYAVAVILKQKPCEVLTQISNLFPVKGRFQTIRSIDGKMAIVDYAHTPDALKNVLDAIAEIRTGKEQIITVVGAGGDRDKTKRPEMAEEAVNASDKVVLTSDNPRTEEPALIIKDMEMGVDSSCKNKVVSIVNRHEAIKTAIMMANSGDIILIAGKGHEDYQEINGVKHHFDDVEEVKKCFGIDINE